MPLLPAGQAVLVRQARSGDVSASRVAYREVHAVRPIVGILVARLKRSWG